MDGTAGSSENALLERDSSGIHVELRYLPTMDLVGVHVRVGDADAGQWRTCRKADALDVFHHPFAYGFKLEASE